MTHSRLSRLPSRALPAACLLLAAALAPSPAVAAEDQLQLRYDVSVASVNSLKLSYDARLSPDAYTASIDVETRGIVDWVVNFNLGIDAAGRGSEGHFVPASFRITTKDSRKKRVAEVVWQDGKPPGVKRNFDLSPERQAQVDAALAANTPDPITVLTSMMTASPDALCTGSFRSYNGTEMVDYVFSNEGRTSLDSGAYKGPATRCRLVLKPVAGFGAGKLKDWTDNPPSYDIYYAAVRSDAFGHPINVAVAADGKAGGQKFSARASTATLNGKPLTPAE